MEELLAYAYLWSFGLCSDVDYNKILDKEFLKNSKRNILLELEECCFNSQDTFEILKNYFKYNANINENIFGKALFKGLELSYNSNDMNIQEYGYHCYSIWKNLPGSLYHKEPFFTLCYADDCLSFGDEQQTRKLYEKAFDFYK
ncbi:hypothetical protein [Porcipelethomonas sp.]|uniref:hypothetical protein n=1 Tax=Porcipelethomonas sp. TaxID=2981675 RepID=UPI003EF7E071